MATGAPGTNGVWQYGEDDSEATFSALLNKAASTTDAAIGTDRGRLTALEAVPQPGLVRIIPGSTAYTGGSAPTVSSNGEVTFGSSTVISLNNVFSSAYKKYRISFINTAATGNQTGVFMRLRSGTDNGATTYTQAGNYVTHSGGSGLRTRSGATEWFVFETGAVSVAGGSMWIDIAYPYETNKTFFDGQMSSTNGAVLLHDQWGGVHDTQASFNGFTMFCSSAFSGKIQVFGYRN